MRIQRGKKCETLSPDEFLEILRPYPRVLLDVGAGDGAFVYREAREHADTLCIALEPVGENMIEFSAKAIKKPARGGVENAIFLVDSAENLPAALSGRATRLTINYPWGALLRAMARPEPTLLSRLAAACQPDARMVCLLNASVFADPGYVERLDLPTLDVEYVARHLVPAYLGVGLRIDQYRYLEHEPPPHRTTWGQRLVRGSQRQTLLIEATVHPQSPLPERPVSW